MPIGLENSFGRPVSTVAWILGALPALCLQVFPATDTFLARAAEALQTKSSAFADYHDVAAVAGIRHEVVHGDPDRKKYIIETTGNGVALLDFDNDGWLDVFFVNGSTLEGFEDPAKAPINHLYRNGGDGKFTDVTHAAGLAQSGWGQGVCVGDWNDDGFDDLFVTYYGPDHLYQNRGDGTFLEVTEKVGLPQEPKRWSTGCTFVDFDRDGDLDLFVAHYLKFDFASVPEPGETHHCKWKGMPVMCGPRGLPGETNSLFQNNGDGSFTDVSEQTGASAPTDNYAFSPLVADFNNDSWPDIYVACDSTPNLLYINEQGKGFREEGSFSGAAFSEEGRSQAGMGVTAADYDHNGFIDLFVTNFSDDYFTLYSNGGDLFFTDVTQSVNLGANTRYLGWGTGFLDVDHDGWKDLLAANGHVYPEVETLGEQYRQSKLLYRNQRDGKFEDVTQQAGPGILQRHASRGVAFGDLDNDGKIEIVVSNMGEQPSLLVNRRAAANAVLVRLVGRESNPNGIGARVTVAANGSTQVDEVRSGASFMSQDEFRLHFGLGNAERIERLEVRWPSGQIDILQNLEVNAALTVLEGAPKATVKPFGEGFSLWNQL